MQKIGPSGAYLQGNYILSFLEAAPMNDPKVVVYLLSITLRIPSNMGGVDIIAPKCLLQEIFKMNFYELNLLICFHFTAILSPYHY